MTQSTEVPVDREAFDALEKRVSILEGLVACPACKGRGSISTPLGPDECPDCHGTKINRHLTGS